MEKKLKTEYRGDWYLPGLIQFAAPGKLIIDHETGAITLTMISKRQLNGEQINQDHRAYKLNANLILGNIYAYEQSITLYAPSMSTIFEFPIGSSHELTFHSEFVFLGVHFENEDDIQFKNMSFKLSHLDVFFAEKAIFKTESTYYFNDSVFLPEFSQDNFHIRIKGEHHVLVKGNEYKVDGRPFLNIKSDVNRSFDDFLDVASQLRSFFYFALSEPVRIISCEIIYEMKGGMEVYHGPWVRDSNLYSSTRCRPMWRSNQFTNDQIIGFIHKWFELNKSFNHSISLFQFATSDLWKSGNRNFQYNGLTNSLLNMTQAIERMYKDDPMKIEALRIQKLQSVNNFDIIREQIKKIKDNLNEDQLRILQSRLKVTRREGDINYFPLIQIFEEYCTENKEILNGYIDEVDFKKFAANLKDLRDNLSHAHNSEEVLKKLDDGEFSIIFNKTQLLFYVILHKKLGFTDCEIQEVIKNLKILN